MTTETVTTGVLLTVYTGKGCCGSFSDLHRAGDVLMGQALMSSNFASQRLWDDMRREALRQHPWLADVDVTYAPDVEGMTRDEAEAVVTKWVDGISERYGDTHVISSPPETRRVSLFEGLPAKFGGSDD